MPPTLSIEMFAKLRAESERVADLDRVLERAGVLRREWTEAEAHWQAALAREVARGERSLSERYLEAFSEGGGAKASNTEAAPKELGAPKQIDVPTYLAARVEGQAPEPPQHRVAGVAPPAPPTAAHASPRVDPASTVFAPEVAQARPDVERLPFGGKAAAPPPASPVERRLGTGTQFIGESQPVGAGLGGSPAISAKPSAATGPRVDSGLPELSVEQYAWMTATIRRTPPEELGTALGRFGLDADRFSRLEAAWSEHLRVNPAARAEFDRALEQHARRRPSGPTPARQSSSALGDSPLVPGLREASPDSTIAPLPLATASGSLPFRKGMAVPPVNVSSPATGPDHRNDAGGETMSIVHARASAPVTPFEATTFARWTLEAYASFVADRRVDSAVHVRVAYGLASQDEERALLAHMDKRLSNDPAELARWRELVKARLAQRGK